MPVFNAVKWNGYPILPPSFMLSLTEVYDCVLGTTKLPKIIHYEETYPCPHCNKVFQSYSGRRRHMATHTGNFKFTCDVCGAGFMETLKYQRHMAQHIQLQPETHGSTFMYIAPPQRHMAGHIWLHPNYTWLDVYSSTPKTCGATYNSAPETVAQHIVTFRGPRRSEYISAALEMWRPKLLNAITHNILLI